MRITLNRKKRLVRKLVRHAVDALKESRELESGVASAFNKGYYLGMIHATKILWQDRT